MNIKEELFKLQDLNYKNFSSKLIPNISKEEIIGVKVPLIRKLASKMTCEEIEEFLKNLPHQYQEENLLHGYLISRMKDIDDIFKELKLFLPCIDNWAVCDMISIKMFKKYPNIVHKKAISYLKSNKTYIIRFGINILMQFFLNDNFDKKDLKLIAKIDSNEYYVNMAIAWYYSVALVKQYDDSIVLFENNELKKWVHNKSIQKAIESKRVDENKKMYLKSLKIKREN